MNSNVSQMNTLHKAYIKCVDKEMSAYLSGANKGVTEFCTDQKNAYFSHMKDHFPHQFNNIIRVESNTYWVCITFTLCKCI